MKYRTSIRNVDHHRIKIPYSLTRTPDKQPPVTNLGGGGGCGFTTNRAPHVRLLIISLAHLPTLPLSKEPLLSQRPHSISLCPLIKHVGQVWPTIRSLGLGICLVSPLDVVVASPLLGMFIFELQVSPDFYS